MPSYPWQSLKISFFTLWRMLFQLPHVEIQSHLLWLGNFWAGKTTWASNLKTKRRNSFDWMSTFAEKTGTCWFLLLLNLDRIMFYNTVFLNLYFLNIIIIKIVDFRIATDFILWCNRVSQSVGDQKRCLLKRKIIQEMHTFQKVFIINQTKNSCFIVFQFTLIR